MSTKSKRELRKEIEQELTEKIVTQDVFQSRPYTCVVLYVEHKQVVLQFVGFSKVCYPDEWHPIHGNNLAFRKAIAKAAKYVLATKDADKPKVTPKVTPVVITFDKIDK